MVGTVNFVNIPQELKTSCQFCTWKMEKGKGGKGARGSSRLTKVPYKPGTNQKAQTNNPDTFSDFAGAMKACAMGRYDGIGICVAFGVGADYGTSADSSIGADSDIGADSGIGAIDIDHCIREDGTLNDVAASVPGIFKNAYFERFSSSTGLRGFFQVDEDYVFDKTVYYINNRTHGLEIYLPGATNRFATVTGDQYREGSVPHDMAALQTVLDTFIKRKTQVTNSMQLRKNRRTMVEDAKSVHPIPMAAFDQDTSLFNFVNISKPEKKITFNAALAKRLTGNDTINARYLHENSFDFRPVFKIFINTNYLPNVSDMTLFDSGCLKIIPFKRHFEETEQDMVYFLPPLPGRQK